MLIRLWVYLSSSCKLFTVSSASAERAWPCGAREAMKWGGLGQPPGNMILE